MFEVRLLNRGEIVASPSVVAEYGREVTVEVPKTMRVVAVASAPNGDGHSMATVKLSLFAGGKMQRPEESSMLADLSKARSFEYVVKGTSYRFVVLSRKVALPQAKG
jgi:hypothetical protein